MKGGLKRRLSQQRDRYLPLRNTGTKLVLPKPEGAHPVEQHSGTFQHDQQHSGASLFQSALRNLPFLNAAQTSRAPEYSDGAEELTVHWQDNTSLES